MPHGAGLKAVAAASTMNCASFGLDRQAEGGRLDRADQLGHGPAHGLRHRSASGLPVLELGPGTGVITRAILERGVPPEHLYAVEYSPDFVRHLRGAFPA